MLVLNKKQFVLWLTENKANILDFYVGKIPNLEGKNRFTRVNVPAGKMEETVERFATEFAGEYTCLAKEAENTTNSRAPKCFVQLWSEQTAQTGVAVVNSNAPVQDAAYWEQEFERRFELTRLTTLNLELEAKSREMETTGGKLTWFAENLILQLVSGNGISINPLMNGLQNGNQPQHTMQRPAYLKGTASNNEAPSGEEITELKDAVQFLRDTFTDVGLIELAEKLRSNPNKIQMVKQYI